MGRMKMLSRTPILFDEFETKTIPPGIIHVPIVLGPRLSPPARP